MLEPKVVQPELAKLGTRLGGTGQHARMARLPLGTYDTRGLCQGMCLDWTRRVLLGSRSTYLAKPDSKKTPEEKLKRTDEQSKRMAKGQTEFGAAQEKAIADKSVRSDRTREANAALGRAEDEMLRLQRIYKSAKQTEVLSEPTFKTLKLHFPTSVTTNSFTFDSLQVLLRSCGAKMLEIGTKLNKHEDSSPLPAAWKTYVEVMDPILKAQKVKSTEDPTRKYSMIELVHPQKAALNKPYAGMIETILTMKNDATGAPWMTDNMTAMITVALGASVGPGHTVAFKRVNDGAFELIDPNYGIYSCTRDGLKKIFEYLFTKAYHDEIPGTAKFELFKVAHT